MPIQTVPISAPQGLPEDPIAQIRRSAIMEALLQGSLPLTGQRPQQAGGGGGGMSPPLSALKNIPGLGGGSAAAAFPSSTAAASSTATGPGGFLVGGGVTSAGAGTGAGAGAGGGSAMSALGPAALFAALIGSGKIIENNNADNPLGRGLLSGLGPSFNQMKADPKLALTTALGVPFINGAIRNDKAAHAEPEWKFLLGG